jgi:transposase
MSTSASAVPTPTLTGRRPGDLKALEQRRRQAAAMFGKGATQAEVARAFGVSPQTASRWQADLEQGGLRGLRASPRSGRPAQLTAQQRQQLQQLILAGAVAAGYDNDLWTLKRIRELIERRFGVRYHRSHVHRLVRSLGLTPQRPARVAVERDQARIARWVAKEWPLLVQTPIRAERGCASKTNPEFP